MSNLDRLSTAVQARAALIAIGLATLVSRLAFAADEPTEWDSVQLTLGTENFDVVANSPHAPGYWVWVTLGRFVDAVTWLDGHDSLIVLSAIGAALTVVLAAIVGRELGGRWVAAAAAAVMFASPYMWFYGSIVATYISDSLVALVLLLLALRARPNSRHGLLAVAVLAAGAGLRPTMFLLFGPLAFVAFVRSTRSLKSVLVAAGVGISIVAAWLIPLVLQQPGGFAAWRKASSDILDGAAEQTSIFAGAPNADVNIVHAISQTLVAAGPLLLLAFFGVLTLVAHRRKARENTWKFIALAASILPAFLFVALVHFAKGGYVLAYLPGIVLGCLWAVSHWQGWLQKAATVFIAVVCLFSAQRFVFADGVIEQSQVFEADAQNGLDFDRKGVQFIRWTSFGAPYKFTSNEIERTDAETEAYARVSEIADPAKDVIVYVIGNGGHRYRHATYVLPQFETQLIAGGKVVMKSENRRLVNTSDSTVALEPGGRAFFMLDDPDAEVRSVLDEVTLPSLVKGWVGQPGDEAYGVRITVR